MNWCKVSIDKGWELEVGVFDIRLQQNVSFKFRTKGGSKRKVDVSAEGK